MKYFFCIFLASASVFASGPAASNDCLVLRGAQIASTVLPGQYTGYGDINYWVKVFEMNRDNANNIAQDLSHRIAPLLASKSRAKAVKEIAYNITSAAQSGYGDLNYWSSMVTNQVNYYTTCAHNLNTLVTLTCND